MKPKNNWTLFGAGNFIFDIIDAIKANDGTVDYLVLNQKLEKSIEKQLPKEIEIIALNKFKPKTTNYFFGFIDPNKSELLEKLARFQIQFSNIIHPFAYVSDTVSLGSGNFIGPGVVLGPNVKLSNFNFFNRASSIGHNVEIGNFNHFGPASTVCGRCLIGDENFLGASSTLIDGIKIANQILLGAGALVTRDLESPGTYVGIPAKLKK